MTKAPGSREGKSSGRGQRDLRVRVKTAKGRKLSSKLWLERQLNDPYVARAKREGYRGRAAYKILELDDKYRFLVPGARVVDLGCAPGGWCQVAVSRVNALGEKGGKAVGKLSMKDIMNLFRRDAEYDGVHGLPEAAVSKGLDFGSRRGLLESHEKVDGGRAGPVMDDARRDRGFSGYARLKARNEDVVYGRR